MGDLKFIKEFNLVQKEDLNLDHSLHSEKLVNWLAGWVRQAICGFRGGGQLVLRGSASDKLSGRAGGGARAHRASARARSSAGIYMGLTPACPRPPRRLPLRPRHWLLRKRYPTDIHDAHIPSAKLTQAQNTFRCHCLRQESLIYGVPVR